MRKPESFLSIFLGNLVFVSLVIGGGFWFWASHMYSVGMDVDLAPTLSVATISILIVATLLSYLTWKITKGRY